MASVVVAGTSTGGCPSGTSRLSSPLAVGGIISILLGLILVIAGLITLVSNQSHPGAWYIWFLLIFGLVAGVAGGVMLAISLSQACAVSINTGLPMAQQGPSYQQVPVAVYTEPSRIGATPLPISSSTPSSSGLQLNFRNPPITSAQSFYQPSTESQIGYLASNTLTGAETPTATTSPVRVGYQSTNSSGTPTGTGYQVPSLSGTPAATGYQVPSLSGTPAGTGYLYPSSSLPTQPTLVNEGKSPVSTTLQISSKGAPSVTYK
jgi:hypothetical protein